MPLAELASDPDVLQALGDAAAVAALPTSRPVEVALLAGIRTAKSMLAAATAIRASQTVSIEHLAPGEIPRVAIVSLSLDLAHVVFRHIAGTMMARPGLARLVIGEPKADSIMVRHPSGRPVEIKVSPLSSAGSSLVARWLLGCIFDEAPRMAGADDGVRNLTDARTAAIGRLLPGGQILTIGSPWAPFGPVYQLVSEHFGKPSPRIVVIRGNGPAMNPEWWTPERIESIKQTDPTAYQTDILGEFADPETSMFSTTELEAVTRKDRPEIPREAGCEYVAAMDPATRGNGWTLVVMTRKKGADGKARRIVVLVKQWVGSKLAPLSPDKTLGEIAAICKSYGIDVAETDQHSTDPLKDIAARYELYLREHVLTQTSKVELFDGLQRIVGDGAIELPADVVLRADLLSVRKRVTQSGLSIELPKTSDGRHADYAPALAIAASRPLEAAELDVVRPQFGTPDYYKWIQSPAYLQRLEDERIAREEEALRREQTSDEPWWDTPSSAA